jgi:mannose-6-phosphate isomerase-like protein (cupin superfamily)
MSRSADDGPPLPDATDPAASLVFEHPALGSGTLEGYLTGASVSLIFENETSAGRGPRLHRHPYDETFIILMGSARFILGDTTLVARAGQLLVAPAATPHKFETLSEYRAIHVHAGPRFITDWLE